MAAVLAETYRNVFNAINPVFLESMRIFPETLVIASGIYAVLVQSFPYGVFFGSLVEATVIFSLLKSFLLYTGAGEFFRTVTPTTGSCLPAFQIPVITNLSGFRQTPNDYNVLSAPIFMLSVASAYLFTTLQMQTKELQALGPAYSSRYYSSIIFLLSILFIMMLFRLYNGCDEFGLVIISALVGLFFGALFVYQNLRLFGAQSINLIGIPLLRNRTANGKKLYVCPK